MINFPITPALVPLSFPSNPTTILYSFLCLMFSLCLVRWNAGLSTWNKNSVCWWNIFLNGIVVVEPAFTIYGPWGLGGIHVPNSGKMYSPPCGDEMVSRARCSPSFEGSNVTSSATSVPPCDPGAAATVFSVWKSLLSTCKYSERLLIDSYYSQNYCLYSNIKRFWMQHVT